jgi:Icc protein
MIHTDDLSHLSKPSEFDTLDQALRGAAAKQIYFVPDEHDMLTDNGEQYLQRFGKDSKGTGWYSFDHKGGTFCRPGERFQSESRRVGIARARAA